MVLPRMGALAEVQWLQPEAKNFEQFKKRITKMRDIYELYRWTVAPHLWQESK
jgi:hexosaminidase